MELRSKKNNNIHSKLVGYFTKNGKMTKSRAIIIGAIVNASRSLDFKAIDVIFRIVRALAVVVDLRTVKIRRNVFTVPVPVNSSRRDYLIVKKLSKAINENKSRINLEKKINTRVFKYS